ncbi:MAG: hypothetical protein FRX48_07044 [Lasallia pustulata]|uniref:Sacsin/Nov domain-containing protein n=1 Tax=Lasallia pustulata TaxID=136370 RepID=A0A5M8PKC9_9LECA|nr:MAG: hypothetical protein FRX48_07044 [Lasallia pustulata]
MAHKIDYNALRAQTLGAANEEEAVTVNTRALIDKVLARYSGEWTVLRELLQNAADASASKVTIKFDTLPSTTVPVPQGSDSAALLKHTLLHHTLKRLLVSNNGQPFGTHDWSRLKRIAEGNPDETKIGAFGVGFYSVFADCEEPFVSSGREAMAFYWKGNSLFTRRLQLPESQSSSETSFVLDYRSTSSPVPGLLSLCQFLASSLTFVGLQCIELWLDDWRLLLLNKVAAPSQDVQMPKDLETKTSEGLMKVTSVSREMAQLDAIWLNIIGWKPKSSLGTAFGVGQSSTMKGAQSSQSLRSFFSRLAVGPNSAATEKAAKEDRASQEAISEDLVGESKATVFLHVHTGTICTSVSQSFSQELERATKKPPPKSTIIAILTSSYDESAASVSSVSGKASKATDIFGSVLPSNSGRIFIGFPTHQTTGLSAHISAPSVIPTVERESIDLNARWVRTWNMEMLRAAGVVCRVAWSGEMDNVRDKLSRKLADAGKNKFSKEHILTVLPEAVHILNTFTFRESTPSSHVGGLVEEAFWTCNRKASIDILSSCGVLPSQDVRIAVEDLSFVEGIPVLPDTLMEQASGFVKKLTDYGIITDITISDIKKELEAKALTSKQLMQFLSWLGHKAQVNDVDGALVRSLLDVAVANINDDDTEKGRVLVLGNVRHFLNPSRIPADMPVPPNTMPFKFTKSLSKTELDALGWEDLQMVPWLRWLVGNTGGRGDLSKEHDVTHVPSFAGLVLPLISKQWEGLSSSSKATVVELMSPRTVIPTKLGMRKPSEAYFPSVKLFDDLPVISGLHSVKEKVLTALGVRKTIELGVVFARLMATSADSKEGLQSPQARWSHVDLIKYLASVRNDIPPDDIKRLRSTPLCPAEDSHSSQGISRRYLVSELFEPTDDLRSLKLPLLQWPGLYRPGSAEGRFLSSLGLRALPSAQELIDIMASAGATGEFALRDHALRYYINHHQMHGYGNHNTASVPTPFLPLQGADAKKLVTPLQCFTNEEAAILGFDILRKDLHVHALKFGVQSDPPMSECISRLILNPPQSKRNARNVFGYFAGRLGEMGSQHVATLTDAKIVPVPTRSATSNDYPAEKPESVRHLSPRVCFLGDGVQYSEIFDYVDFGQQANLFLLKCGSKHEPSTLELAQLVVREPARVFTSFQSTERYLQLLRALAESWSVLRKDKVLVKDMKKVPFLLAYKEMPPSARKVEQNKRQQADPSDDYDDEEDPGIKTWQLASAGQTVIMDDLISYNLFKGSLLVAPWEETLETFYLNLGAAMLGDLVEEQYRFGDVVHDQKSAIRLQKRVHERSRLFLHDSPREAIKHDAKWLEKNLKVVAVRSISLTKTLRGHRLSHSESTSAAASYVKQDKSAVLYITDGNYDLFQVSQALLPLLLSRPKPEKAMMFEMLLGTDLLKLRARGYNVERILRQKQAEARIAEEQRQKQLEEEQKEIKERELSWKDHEAQHAPKVQDQVSMPGLFPDSPDRNLAGYSGQDKTLEDDRSSRRPRGLFSEITKRLGFDDNRRHSSQLGIAGNIAGRNSNGTQDDQLAPPPYAQEDIQQHKSVKPAAPPETATAPHHLQQNLVNAIQASRAHNSQTVVSQPAVNAVKETRSYCDARPGQNITYFADSRSGIKLFLSNNIVDRNKFMAENSSALNAFAAILLECASAFALARNTIHIFYDEVGSTIAFNSKKALFCNYRYFENLHLPDVQQGNKADALVYWFVVLCHELAHNLVADHSADHSYYSEQLVIRYFANVAAKIAQQGSGDGQATITPVPSSDPVQLRQRIPRSMLDVE